MTDRSRSPMGSPPRNRSEMLRIKASEFFQEKKKRSETFLEQMQTDRVVSDAKTAKLRALRLAKEAADRNAPPGSNPEVSMKTVDTTGRESN